MISAIRLILLSALLTSLLACGQQSVSINTEFDFLYLLDKAEIKSENPSFVYPIRHSLNDVPRWGIFSHAPSTIVYENIYIGENAALDFSIGILTDAWKQPGDGVKFQIAASNLDSATKTLFSKYIDPKKNENERKWNSYRIAIEEIKNSTVTLHFSTIPSESPEEQDNGSDWAVWGNPRLISNGQSATKKRSHNKTNVILITIDTLRQDYTGLANPEIRTPTIKRLADRGIQFDRAYSTISTTSPSHVTILTSMYPFVHGVVSNSFHLAPAVPLLPQLFAEEGYRTGAAVSVYHLIDEISGLGQWFETYDCMDHRKWLKTGSKDMALLTRSGSATTSASIDWLDRVHDDPFFLWVHYYDPHSPYEAEGDYHKMYYEGDPSHWNHKSMKDALYHEKLPYGATDWIRPYTDLDYFKKEYAAEITYTDNQIKRLIDAIKRLKVYDNTLIAITSDHGENLGEHDIYFDHWTLFNTDIHVPLVIHYPKKIPQGLRVHDGVSQIDIAPTILDIAGMSDNYTAREVFQGRSLRPLWEGKSDESTNILTADGLLFKEISGWDETYKVTWELREAKYHDKLTLHLDRVWVFDVKNDPKEEHPIACFYWKSKEERKEYRKKLIDRLTPFNECIVALGKVMAAHPEWADQTQIPPLDELASWFYELYPGDNALSAYLKEIKQVPSPQDLQAMLDTQKMKIIIEMTSKRASEKEVPSVEELKAWFKNPEDGVFISEKSLQDPNFYGHIQQILQVLKDRMLIVPMRERLKSVMDVTDLEDANLLSKPMFVGSAVEAMKYLGYAD